MVDDTSADNLGDQLQQSVDKLVDDSTRLHTIVHGPASPGTVAVEGGSVRTVSKLQADIETAATGQRNAIGQEAVTQRQGIDTAATSQRTAIDNAATTLAGNILEASELQIGILQQWDYLSEWDGATAYAKYNVVSYMGSAYIALKQGSNRNPETAVTFWHKMVSKGDPGDGRPVDADVREGGVLYAGLVDAIEALGRPVDADVREGGVLYEGVKDAIEALGFSNDDLALETDDYERLCTVSGADTTPSAIHTASLALVCNGGTPTEGTAELGGVIRFTANSAFKGSFRIVNDAFEQIGSGTATQIAGGDTGAQEWRIDGAEWDFTYTGGRRLNLLTSTFNPEVNDLTFTFDGELTRGDPDGSAVPLVEAIVNKLIAETPGSGIAEYDATETYDYPAVVAHAGRIWIKKQGTANTAGQAPSETSTVWEGQAKLTDIPTVEAGPRGIQGKGYRALTDPWTSGTTYTVNDAGYDVVFDTEQGGSFVCKQTHTASASNKPPNIDYWIRQSSKGADGTNTNTDSGGGTSEERVEELIDNQLTFDLFESVIGSTAEIRPGTTYIGNKGYQNDNGDDVPQTPDTEVTFTIPTSGSTVSDEINALNDGDLIRLVGTFNPNQRYVRGSQTSTRLVVTQGTKTIKVVDGLAPDGGTVILEGAKKGPNLTAVMTFKWNGFTATMEPEIWGLAVSFTGRMYSDLDRFVVNRVKEGTDPLKNVVGELGTGLREVQATALANEQGLVAVKKTAVELGAKHTPALDALGMGTVSEVDNQVLTETVTAYTKTRHDNPTQFNEGLVNLTSGDLTIGEVVLASVKNDGLYFNLHDAGTPASSTTTPQYIGLPTGESNPVEIHLNTDVTETLTNNLPPAGTAVRIFVEADVNEIDEEDTILDLVATVGQTVTHEVLHLGAVITLTATWQGNGLLLRTVKSGTQNQAVDGGRLLVNPVWQKTTTTDKVDASDTLTRVADHHGNAALYVHSVGGVYHIDYSGGSFDTNTAHTSQTNIATTLPWVITVDSNFPANMHDLQAQADANNEFLGLWYYVNHPSQVYTLPMGLEFTQPDGTVVSAGGGGTDIITFSDNAETLGAHREFGGGVRFETVVLDLTGSEIANGGKSITVPPGTNIVFMGYSAEVITANSTAATITIRGGKSIPNTGEDGSYTIALGEAGATIAHAFGIARNDKTSTLTLSGATGTIDATAVLRLSIRIYQTVPTGIMPAQRTASTNAGESGGGGAITEIRQTLTGEEIATGAIVIDDPRATKNVCVGFAVKVIEPCSVSDTINFVAHIPFSAVVATLDVSLKSKGLASISLSGTIASFSINAVDATPSSTCQVELIIGIIEFNPQ